MAPIYQNIMKNIAHKWLVRFLAYLVQTSTKGGRLSYRTSVHIADCENDINDKNMRNIAFLLSYE